MLEIENKTALEILGRPDERKLKSCMTLFSLLPEAPDCFREVLENITMEDRTKKHCSL